MSDLQPAHAENRTLLRRILGALKLALAIGIVGYLLYGLSKQGTFQRLIDEPKQWGLLAAAQACIIGAIVMNFCRWYVLVRALDLKFPLVDAFRLGSVGFLLNQVSLGSVGGDLFKAIFIAREQPGRRTEAVASVLIDRVVGMYAMMLVATFGRFAAGGELPAGGVVPQLAAVVAGFTILGTIGIGLLMTPLMAGPKTRALVARMPIVGGTAERVLAAADAYRHQRRYLFAAIAMSCVSHTMFATSFWLIARGLPVAAPRFGEMLLIGPLSLCAGAVPLTPSGLGVAEGAMGELFRAFGYVRGDGQLVAITFRAMNYVMAALGAAYYISARRKFAAVLDGAEHVADRATA